MRFACFDVSMSTPASEDLDVATHRPLAHAELFGDFRDPAPFLEPAKRVPHTQRARDLPEITFRYIENLAAKAP